MAVAVEVGDAHPASVPSVSSISFWKTELFNAGLRMLGMPL